MNNASTPLFVDALREWVETVMHRSMHGFLSYAKQNNLSMSQMGALLHVQRMGACGVSAISDDLGVSNAAVSQMLDRLVEGDLVIREEDPRDRRSKRIELTPKGEKILRGTMEFRQRWFQALADSLTDEERADALRTLQTLTSRTVNLEEMPS
jgi:DNA-binding MarR family transcriptional regulator